MHIFKLCKSSLEQKRRLRSLQLVRCKMKHFTPFLSFDTKINTAKADVVCETVNILEVQGFGYYTSMGIPRL